MAKKFNNWDSVVDGYVPNDPRVFDTKNGKMYTFAVGFGYPKRGEKDENGKQVYAKYWLNIVGYDNDENISDKLPLIKKSSNIKVKGYMTVSEYVNKNGVNVQQIQLVCQQIEMLEGFNSSNGSAKAQPVAVTQQDDDIPF